MSQPKSPLRKYLPWVLKFGLSVGLIWFLLDGMDMDAAVDKLSSADPWMIIGALALIAVQIPIAALRWQFVLRAIDAPLSFANCNLFFMIGMFFNQVLPSAVGGDAVRIYKAYRAGQTMSEAVNGVMLERVATVFALILLVVVGQPFLMSRIGDNPAAYVFPALAVVGILGILSLMVLDRLPEGLHRWKLVRGLAKLAHDTRRLFLRPGPAIATLVTAIIGHINISLVVWVLALGIGVPVTPLDCIVLVPPVILIMTLPISIAGWGVREKAMVTAFAFIGIPAESSFVLGFLLGLVTVVASLPGGLVFLLTRDPAREPDLDAIAEQVEEAEKA